MFLPWLAVTLRVEEPWWMRTDQDFLSKRKQFFKVSQREAKLTHVVCFLIWILRDKWDDKHWIWTSTAPLRSLYSLKTWMICLFGGWWCIWIVLFLVWNDFSVEMFSEFRKHDLGVQIWIYCVFLNLQFCFLFFHIPKKSKLWHAYIHTWWS